MASPVLVECNNKQCVDADGRRSFVTNGPDRVETKQRYPDGRWSLDPDDHLAPMTFDDRGTDPVVQVIDVYVCPRCGSPIAKPRG